MTIHTTTKDAVHIRIGATDGNGCYGTGYWIEVTQ